MQSGAVPDSRLFREIFDYSFGTMDAYVRVGCIDGYLAKAAAARASSKRDKAQ